MAGGHSALASNNNVAAWNAHPTMLPAAAAVVAKPRVDGPPVRVCIDSGGAEVMSQLENKAHVDVVGGWVDALLKQGCNGRLPRFRDPEESALQRPPTASVTSPTTAQSPEDVTSQPKPTSTATCGRSQACDMTALTSAKARAAIADEPAAASGVASTAGVVDGSDINLEI
jgi:hypothetical protein